ncbi:MAG: hypothetical protein M3P40_03490 [Actinomycetota bacterium]|nr:hypothetical protein [Actinomycetota bacterium]
MSDSGQASSDYVALVAVVALVLGGVAAVATPALGYSVLGAMRHAVCVVGGAICSSEEAHRAGLDPCVVQLESDGRRVGVAIVVVRLRRGDKMVVERKSDGSTSVAFVDDRDLGVETGIGLKLGKAGLNVKAEAGGGARFTTGRAYSFADWETARTFMERYAHEEDTMGELKNAARSIAPGHLPHELPSAQETSYEAGGWTEVDAVFDTPNPGRASKEAQAGTDGAVILGRRRRGSQTTVYVQLDRAASLGLGAVVSAVGASFGSVLGVTFTDGKMTNAVVSGSAEVSSDFELYGHSTSMKALGTKLRSGAVSSEAAVRSGRAVESRVSLDLREPHNRAAVEGMLEVVSGRAPVVLWPGRIKALGQRLDQNGKVDLELFDTNTSESDSSLEAALGLKAGIEDVRTHSSRRLIGAWTASGGDAIREREDCLNAVPASPPPPPIA